MATGAWEMVNQWSGIIGNIDLLLFPMRIFRKMTASHRAHLQSHSGRDAGVAPAHCPTTPEFTIPPLQDVAARKTAVATHRGHV